MKFVGVVGSTIYLVHENMQFAVSAPSVYKKEPVIGSYTDTGGNKQIVKRDSIYGVQIIKELRKI